MIQEQTKHQDVIDRLRQQIVNGELSPGQRLKTYGQIKDEYNVCHATVLRAIDRLKRDGFVRSDGRRGMFVSDHPPHLFTYALVYPSQPDADKHWAGVCAAVASEAIALEQATGQTVKIRHYYNVDGHIDNEGYQSLLHEAQADRLAGMILLDPGDSLLCSDLVSQAYVPCVALTYKSLTGDICQVDYNTAAFASRAVDYLQQQGKYNIAVLAASDDKLAIFTGELAKRGLRTEPYWQFVLSPAMPGAAASICHLLMQALPDRRPDGLVIANDNMVEHALHGISQARMKVPDELGIVGHSNWPLLSTPVLPIKRLGFYAGQTLRMCMDAIDAFRRGDVAPVCQIVEPMFEDEYRQAERDLHAVVRA
jgi:DNA-binding LacI/PurR family transcriptional regulator